MPAVSEQTATDPLILHNSPQIDEETPMNPKSGGGDRRKPPRPAPSWSLGDYAKSIVYGGMDAIVTCFSLISSISGGRLSSGDVLVLGFANLVADGISMGFGDYVSTVTEKDMAMRDREVTVWEATGDDSVGARARMCRGLIQRYMNLGMDFEDASTVVNIFSKYNNVIVEETLVQRKGLCPPDETEKPWKNGLVTFAAFIVFGCAPLLSFIVLIPFTQNESVKFGGACLLSMLALALLGFAKAKMAGENYVLSALMTILNGAIAASVAYAVGWTLRNVAGLDDAGP